MFCSQINLCWVICWSAATSSWLVLSERTRGLWMMPWERTQQSCGCWKPRETERCRVGWEQRCFPGWVLLVFTKAMAHYTLAQVKEMREWDSPWAKRWLGGLRSGRVQEQMYPYFKMYSCLGCTEGLFAGEMSRFTILIRTCVVGVAASTANPKPTRNWRRKAIPGTVWGDFRKGECKTLQVRARWKKRGNTSPTQGHVKQTRHILGICLAVVCCLGTRCHHALWLDGWGCSPWWANRRTKVRAQAPKEPTWFNVQLQLIFLRINSSRLRSPSDKLKHSNTPVFFQLFSFQPFLGFVWFSFAELQ